MGKEIKIVIPSHLRHDRVTTNKAVANCILCVAESQKELYQEYHKKTEIVTHPDNVIGIAAKREWIYQYFGDVFMIDDDVASMNRLYTEKGEKARVDKTTAYELIQWLYNLALMTDAKLFSFSKNPMPTAYNPMKPIDFTGVIMGGAFGMLKTDKLTFKSKLNLNEDYFLSGLNAHFYRKCLIDNRFTFSFRNTFANKGGLANYRTLDKEKEDTFILKEYFGEAIQLKKDTHLAKVVMPYARSLKIPF